MPLEPLASQKKADYVIEQIALAIQEGQFKVGEQLPPERELAVMLNVGRSSIREALGILQTAGVVNVKHGTGTFVRSQPSPHLFSRPFSYLTSGGEGLVQLTSARHALEQGLAYVAASQREELGVNSMSEAVEAMRAAARKDDIDAFLDADILFHKGLAQASGNSVLESMEQGLLTSLDSTEYRKLRRAYYGEDSQKLEDFIKVHRQLYTAIRSGDKLAAVEAVHQHYSEVVAPLIDRE